MRWVAPAVVVGLLALSQAQAASIYHFTSKEGREVVSLAGDLIPGDADRLVAAIKDANNAGREVSGVRLNSNGGSLEEGVKIAEAVKFAKIATVIMNGTVCASACFVAFAAGTEKYVSYTAQVGVHGASQQGSDAPAGTVAMAKIVRDLGVPPAIIGQMVVTPPDQIVWLSPADLQSMGVKMTGKPTQTMAGVSTLSPATPSLPIAVQAAPAVSASLPQTGDQNWSAIINDAMARSTAQNGGTARSARNCQPELKLCNTAIFFKGLDGTDMMVRVSADVNEKVLARNICTFNSFGDIRECWDFDKKQGIKEMKNERGDWVTVER